MGAATGLMAYFMIWWVVLQAVLPWGVKTPEHPEPGMADSAPVDPRLKIKVLATTVIAAVVWGLLYLLIEYSGFSFRDWARSL